MIIPLPSKIVCQAIVDNSEFIHSGRINSNDIIVELSRCRSVKIKHSG